MSPTLVGILGLIALFGLLILRMPVAMSMMVTGFAGIVAINGLAAAYSTLSS